MATSTLNPTQLIFTSDGTDVNAQLTASDDTFTLFSTGGANNSVAVENAASLQMIGSTSGTFTQQPAATTTSYTVTWPNAQGSSGQTLENDGAGVLSWVTNATPAAISWKNPVVVATVTAGTLATDFENGDTVNGVTLATGDRILIKDQASGVENGIYTVNVTGAPTRATDLDTGASAAGIAVIATEGTVNSDTAYVCMNDDGSDVVGTDALVFAAFGSSTPAAGNTGDIQYNSGTDTFAAATLSDFTFTDNASTPNLAVGVEAGTFSLNAQNATTAATTGSTLTLNAGNGNTTAAGGSINLNGGTGGATGDGGQVRMISGNGGGTSGNAGDAIVSGGIPTDGNGGNILISASDGVGTDRDGGNVTIESGANTGTGTAGTITFVGGETASTNVGFTFEDNAGTNALTILSGTQNATSTTTGTLRVVGGLGVTQDIFCNTITTTSDVRLKTNINPIFNPLDKLRKIEGYTFHWKDPTLSKKKQLGLLAQQLEEIGMDNLVEGTNETQKGVNYLSLIPLIIESIKQIADDIY